nr:PREDICTED: uncharacterized protein LOC109042950 isoform X1 [Bemisia tabaci]XP_018915481.1 PREDICTED: uncharacterized protein LOC109042950 isoform X1 [Bemisia tabaci]
MDLHERLNAFIFPEAVSSGCFGDDVQKYVGFKTHERKGIINFCSQIIFGEVTLERQAGGCFSQSVVIKTQNRQPSADLLAMFHNEVLFYTKIVPLFQKYDKERFLSTSLPKFVYGKATDGLKPDEDIIIFKDLAQDGFKPSENPYFLNEKHIELVLDRLGKYHALSFMCKFDDPIGFKEISTQILKLSSFPLDFAFPTKEAFRHCMLRGVEPLEGDPKHRAGLAKLCANIDTVRGRMDGLRGRLRAFDRSSPWRFPPK